jgi:hypothetical protein
MNEHHQRGDLRGLLGSELYALPFAGGSNTAWRTALR